MAVNSIFGRSTTRWIRYSDYDYKQADSGEIYLTPAPKSVSAVYDPLENPEEMIVNAINIGLLCLSRGIDESRIQAEIAVFAEKYGLLGFMTALPTTPKFMEYETVYLPKNRYLKAESMQTTEYIKLFFPFEDEVNTNPNPSKVYRADDGSLRVSLAARNKPKALEMSYQRSYAEPYEWLRTVFKDWAFMFCASFMYYEETDPIMAELHRQSISVFDGNVPTYHIELFDKPTLVWDFHSLLLMIQMMFSLMLTDASNPLRSCKHCNRAFVTKHPVAVFCSPKCKNQFNVYKSRGKK